MISYRLESILSRCLRRSKYFWRVELKHEYLKHPYSTCSYILYSPWTKMPKQVSLECEVPWYISYISIRAIQTSKDSVSEQLVYKGELRNNIKMLKVLTLSTSIGGLSVQPLLLNKLWQTSPYFACSLGIFSTFFILVTPLLVHLFTRRYVTELYFNPITKTFQATTLTMLIMKKKTTFTADDVYVPTIPGFFTTFLVNNTPMFVDRESFTDIEAYEHLMGYDKPIDFHFDKAISEKNNAK